MSNLGSVVPSSVSSQGKPPKYWKGYVTVEADLAKIRERLESSREGKYRDGWWRFYAINKIEGPLLQVLEARARGEHLAFRTVWTAKNPRGQR